MLCFLGEKTPSSVCSSSMAGHSDPCSPESSTTYHLPFLSPSSTECGRGWTVPQGRGSVTPGQVPMSAFTTLRGRGTTYTLNSRRSSTESSTTSAPQWTVIKTRNRSAEQRALRAAKKNQAKNGSFTTFHQIFISINSSMYLNLYLYLNLSALFYFC